MKRLNFSSEPGLLRRAAILAILAAAIGYFAVPAMAGPKGTIHVRPLGDRKLTIDGDISDWPLAQFKKVAEQPVFPAGQNADSTTADGDHLVFEKQRIGLFNGTTDEAFEANDSDFGVTTYFAYDLRNLYILAVFIDDTLRDDNDTTEFGSTGYLNDGFEFFLDAKGDSTDCISDDAFPSIDQAEPNVDDFQVTVAINSTFKPAGSPDNVLGARQNVERAGNVDFIGPDKGGPGGIYRDQLDAGPGPDIAARKYDDLRAAGALNPEIAAKPNVKFTGYAIEMRVPLRGKIPDVVANHAMGFEIFWRDVDAEGDPGAGGNISWASWAQSTAVDCGDPKTSLFHTANWGQLVFDDTDPLVPIPADKPTILFVTDNSSTTLRADIDLIEFFQDAGYAVVPFTAAGSTPEGLREAAAGKKVVFLSESIGSTSVVDPALDATGVFSLKDTDVPVISFEAYMYDNADWVVRTADGSNDFSKWGNSGRNDNDGTDIGVPTVIQDARDSLYIKNSTHPITTGFSGKVKTYVEPYSFNYGILSPDADVLASIQEDGSFPTLFVYEKGDKLADGTVAPNKRIGLFLGQVASPNANFDVAFTNLTAEGKTLILNTVKYAVGATNTPPAAAGPVELGQTVNGFQDDFTGATRDPNWKPHGPAGDIYKQAGGLLSIAVPTGDPNHLLYEAPGYSTNVQEVLARMRVTAFGPMGDYPRGGLGVGVGTNSQGINLNFRDSIQDNFGRHFRLLDDLRAWGPGTNIDWEIGNWFWLRLRQEPNAAGGTGDVFAKIWPADGVTAEPAQPQVTWNYTPGQTVRAGFAGITGSSSQTGVGVDTLEVDYILIKAEGLPQITVAFSPLPPETPVGVTIGIARSGTDAVITYTGTLEAADAVNGPWTTVAGATSPSTVPLSSAAAKFYRSKQ